MLWGLSEYWFQSKEQIAATFIPSPKEKSKVWWASLDIRYQCSWATLTHWPGDPKSCLLEIGRLTREGATAAPYSSERGYARRALSNRNPTDTVIAIKLWQQTQPEIMVCNSRKRKETPVYSKRENREFESCFSWVAGQKGTAVLHWFHFFDISLYIIVIKLKN